MDCSPTGASVHGISQARIVEWFAISSSRGSSRSGMQQCLFHLLHQQVDSLPLSHQRGPDQETAPRNFRALEIREDTKNFWKGKKKCHTLFIRQSLTGEEIISLCQGLKSVKFFFYKTVTEMFRTRKDTHQSKVVFSHKILSFLLKTMVNYSQKMLKLVSWPFSLMRSLLNGVKYQSRDSRPTCHLSWEEGCTEEDKNKAIFIPLHRIYIYRSIYLGFPGGSDNKRICPPVQKTPKPWVLSLGREGPLEKGMATNSSILAWRIPRTEDLASYKKI